MEIKCKITYFNLIFFINYRENSSRDPTNIDVRYALFSLFKWKTFTIILQVKKKLTEFL